MTFTGAKARQTVTHVRSQQKQTTFFLIREALAGLFVCKDIHYCLLHCKNEYILSNQNSCGNRLQAILL